MAFGEQWPRFHSYGKLIAAARQTKKDWQRTTFSPTPPKLPTAPITQLGFSQSPAPNVADEAGKLISDNSRTLAPVAVGSQVALMSVVSIIYEPKVKYHIGNKPPPRISDSIFGWLPPLLHTKEPELLGKIGLDAVAFLRFNRLMRWLFLSIAGLACSVLIPINVTYNLKNINRSKRDGLSILTIRDISGNLLYAHVAVTYLITLMVIGFVHIHWKEMIRLRHTWFRSPEYLESFYARTVTVRRVPKKNQSDEGLRAIFESTKVPYPTTSVHIGRKVGKLPQLIEYHNTTVREFEAVLVKYLKGGKLGKKRPTIRVGATCGMGGMKKDAIDHYTAKLQRTEGAIEEYRRQIDTRKAENYGFASMAAVPYAHVVAKALRGKHPKGTKIELAPNPKDIVWENMNKSEGELFRKRSIGFVWLAVVCFFNTVPLFIISILANLESLRVYVPFLDKWAIASPGTFAFISGVLPPTVSGLFGFFLPIIMRWLTQYMGALTHSKLDRSVIARYFSFLVISQLVIFTLIGVMFNSVREIIEQIGRKASIQEIIDNLGSLPQTVHRTYINQSSYWLTFFPLRGFLVIFDLAQILNLIWISFKTRAFGRTPRDIREWTQPPEFQYAIYYSNVLFMGAVGLVFAPLAPLVVVAAAIVFWLGSFVYKYQLMFVFVSKVESGGRLWNVVVNRLLFSALLMQLLMVLTIGLQYRFKSLQWLSTIPPILFIVAYKIYINRVYVPAFQYFIPTDEEIRLAKVHSERSDARGNRLERRFGHPALHADLFTPMLHAKMMPLLSQVYQGRIGKEEAKMEEYGGQKLEAQVVPGGIKIAAVSQNDLEYDLALYQRDRGELDWDARSMASTVMFDGPDSAAKSLYHGSSPSVSKLPGYDQYMSGGTYHPQQSEIELPLLNSRDYFQQQPSSQLNLAIPPSLYQDPLGSSREAPTHRPQERSYSPYPPEHSPAFSPSQSPELQVTYPSYQHLAARSPEQHYPPRQVSPYYSQQDSSNMAGRGAHRR
ncbi:hypothetical protein H0H87_008255 [Tephrocybe sp. NHM501043]|nr:hypothetical protein H0H87_008255 [Tephrocybe sp. NHM501043]